MSSVETDADAEAVVARRERLARFLRPRSVAIVGASERQARSNNAVEEMRDSGVELFFVNPNRDEVYGEPAHRDLEAIGRPVDAVMSIVSARLAIDVVRDARRTGAGGVVVIAGGFSEAGGEGIALERDLREAAGEMPVLGPNCNGFVRPVSGARLSGAPRLPFPAGRVGVVTHSGALLGALGLAAQERGIGFSSLISTGNEMAVDLAECLEFLVDDDETEAIALVVETVRSPERFLAAALRAAAAGKPVVALKLGRSARGQEIATSHTGALAGEAWVYDAVFRQHGIAMANDLVDLLDRVSLLVQVPRERWTRADGLAVLSLSGGWSAMASDVSADEGVELPALLGLRDAVNAVLPARTTVNPLDMTGFAMGNVDVLRRLLEIYGASPEVDAILLQWFVDETAEGPGSVIIESAREAARSVRKPVILGSIEDGHLGQWARALPAEGVAVGRGLRSTIRGLRTMGDAVRFMERPRTPATVTGGTLAFDPADVVGSSAGPMLRFGATMELLAAAGLAVAPYAVVEKDAPVVGLGLPFAGPYVVKLADVPHRTEWGAVRLGVTGVTLADTIVELRTVAAQHGLPGAVAIQAQATIEGEAIVGLEGDGPLGPTVVCGIGGVLVEVLGRVAGRLAPVSSDDADELLDELADTKVFEGWRGGRPWDREHLRSAVEAVGSLAVRAPWIASLDVNPLAFGPDGFVALDGLCLVHEGAR